MTARHLVIRPSYLKLKNSLIIHEEKTKEISHYRNCGFICDKKIMLIYINFSFDFLGLDNVDFEYYFANELIRWVAF
jgi:hypothetical protein